MRKVKILYGKKVENICGGIKKRFLKCVFYIYFNFIVIRDIFLGIIFGKSR